MKSSTLHWQVRIQPIAFLSRFNNLISPPTASGNSSSTNRTLRIVVHSTQTAKFITPFTFFQMVLAIDGYGQSLQSIELYQLLESSQKILELQQQQNRLYPDLDMDGLSDNSSIPTEDTTYKMEVLGPLYAYYRADKSVDYKHRFIKIKEPLKSKSILQAKSWDPIGSQQSSDYAAFIGAAGGFPINSTRSGNLTI